MSLCDWSSDVSLPISARTPMILWMREVGLAVTIDAIGNIIGVRAGNGGAAHEGLPPVMFGSHVDTVGTGGRYDGQLGRASCRERVESAVDAEAGNRGA